MSIPALVMDLYFHQGVYQCGAGSFGFLFRSGIISNNAYLSELEIFVLCCQNCLLCATKEQIGCDVWSPVVKLL